MIYHTGFCPEHPGFNLTFGPIDYPPRSGSDGYKPDSSVLKVDTTILKLWISLLLFLWITPDITAQVRIRTLGISPGVLETGQFNAITDVPGVRVGHTTMTQGDSVCTGVTAIIPHAGNIFQEKVPAAIFTGNGFGKLAGYTQVEELGNLETPIILTNTLSVATGIQALVEYTLNQPGNEDVRSVNAVVGETNDGQLNDIRGMHVTRQDVWDAIEIATGDTVAEGSVGAGTGTIAFGFKGGIGTASRKLPASTGGYTVGVLVQANFGGILQVDGLPVAEKMGWHPYQSATQKSDGSCMIIVATNAPLDSRNLKRLAKRAMLGLARTGGYASNGSGDYVIAFSTFAKNFDPYLMTSGVQQKDQLANDRMTPLFLATVESTEEAILNALFMATVPDGIEGKGITSIPVDSIMTLINAGRN
jgi:D-aminopeptidase